MVKLELGIGELLGLWGSRFRLGNRKYSDWLETENTDLKIRKERWLFKAVG